LSTGHFTLFDESCPTNVGARECTDTPVHFGERKRQREREKETERERENEREREREREREAQFTTLYWR